MSRAAGAFLTLALLWGASAQTQTEYPDPVAWFSEVECTSNTENEFVELISKTDMTGYNVYLVCTASFASVIRPEPESPLALGSGTDLGNGQFMHHFPLPPVWREPAYGSFEIIGLSMFIAPPEYDDDISTVVQYVNVKGKSSTSRDSNFNYIAPIQIWNISGQFDGASLQLMGTGSSYEDFVWEWAPPTPGMPNAHVDDGGDAPPDGDCEIEKPSFFVKIGISFKVEEDLSEEQLAFTEQGLASHMGITESCVDFIRSRPSASGMFMIFTAPAESESAAHALADLLDVHAVHAALKANAGSLPDGLPPMDEAFVQVMPAPTQTPGWMYWTHNRRDLAILDVDPEAAASTGEFIDSNNLPSSALPVGVSLAGLAVLGLAGIALGRRGRAVQEEVLLVAVDDVEGDIAAQVEPAV